MGSTYQITMVIFTRYPAKLSGYQARAGRIGLSVDNFLTVFFFNDFNSESPKSLESYVFIDFCTGFALFQCPAQKGFKKALQAFIAVSSTQRMCFREI